MTAGRIFLDTFSPTNGRSTRLEVAFITTELCVCVARLLMPQRLVFCILNVFGILEKSQLQLRTDVFFLCPLMCASFDQVLSVVFHTDC